MGFNKIKKAALSLALCSSIFLGFSSQGYADYYSNEIDSSSKRLNIINEKLNKFSKNKNFLDIENQQLKEDLYQLNVLIKSTETRYNLKQTDVNKTRETLMNTYKEIEILEEKLAEREESFRERIKSIQSGDKITLFQIILASKTFGDLITRIFSFKTIVEADNNTITEYLDMVDQLNSKRDKTEKLVKNLEKQLNELEELKHTLSDEYRKVEDLKIQKEIQSKDLNSVILNLKKEKEKLEKDLNELNEERVYWEKVYSEDMLDFEKYLEQNRTIESEISEGRLFITPTKGRFSSPFGERWGRNHDGIDLANNVGTPVVASASGIVKYAGVMNGYGNVITIEHEIDGKTYMTLYAHLDYIGVEVNQHIDQGKAIGLMGNTGRSFGSHLHFEIHEGLWNGEKSNAVDPLKYLK